MRLAPILAAALVTLTLTACGSAEEQAPETEALPLPETLRVAGHAHECDGSRCARHLIVAPAFDAERPPTTTRATARELERALRAARWTEDAKAQLFVSPGHQAAVQVGTPNPDEPWSELLDPPLAAMTGAGQPALPVTLVDPQG